MKISKIHIAAFGKIENLELDLSDGLNILYGKNEAGKTTICEFLKMMFYGSAGRQSDIAKNPRRRYKPWSGAKMGGTVDFISKGTQYRLEREFKASNSTDNIKLINLDTGAEMAVSGSQEIGLRFFGLSGDAFARSVFIGSSAVFGADASADGELNRRLANMLDSGEEDVSSAAVAAIIRAEAEKILSKSRRLGELPAAKERLKELNELKQSAQLTYSKADILSAELKNIESEIEAARLERGRIFNALKSANISETRERLLEFKRCCEAYNELEAKLTDHSGRLTNSAFLEECSKSLSEIEAINLQIESIASEIAKAKAELQELNVSGGNRLEILTERKIRLENELSRKKSELGAHKISKARSNGSAPLPLIIIGALLGIACIIIGLLNVIMPLCIAGGMFLITCALALLIKPSNKFNISELENEAARLENELNSVSAELRELDIRLETGKSLKLHKTEFLNDKNITLLELQNSLAARKSSLFEKLGALTPVASLQNAAEILDNKKRLLTELEKLKATAEYAAAGTGCRNLAEAEARLSSLPEPTGSHSSKEELTELLREAETVGQQLSSQKAELQLKIKQLLGQTKTPAEYDAEIAELSSGVEALEGRHAACLASLEILEQADTEIRKSFGGKLKTRTLEIFRSLTDDRYSDISVSKDFSLSATEKNDISSHSVGVLSMGTHDQAYFALRLAVSEFLSEDSGGMPIILDDIFALYDDTRQSAALEFLKKYAAENQVLFFTCHTQIADTQNVNLIKL